MLAVERTQRSAVVALYCTPLQLQNYSDWKYTEADFSIVVPIVQAIFDEGKIGKHILGCDSLSVAGLNRFLHKLSREYWYYRTSIWNGGSRLWKKPTSLYPMHHARTRARAIWSNKQRKTTFRLWWNKWIESRYRGCFGRLPEGAHANRLDLDLRMKEVSCTSSYHA